MRLPEQSHFVCGVFERRVNSHVGFWGRNVPVREHQDSEGRRQSNQWFLTSDLLRSLADKRENQYYLRPKNGTNRRCQPVASVNGHLGLQYRLLGTRGLGSMGLQCPLAGTPGLVGVMRVLTHGCSPRFYLTRWWRIAKSRPHCTQK